MASENNPHRLDFLRDAWRLAKPYFVSDDRKWAWGLLAAVVALNLFSVFLNVRFNFWRNDFFNTFQNMDEQGFFKQLGIFTILAVLFIVTGVYTTYLQQMLQIRWRRWLTRQYLHDWLEGKAYYRLQLTGGETDNPDQRIAEDLNRFTDTSLSLTLGLLNSVVTLFSFVGILWELSGPITVQDVGAEERAVVAAERGLNLLIYGRGIQHGPDAEQGRGVDGLELDLLADQLAASRRRGSNLKLTTDWVPLD